MFRKKYVIIDDRKVLVMRNKKGNIGLVVSLVVFIILTLVLGGYIVYDKVINNDEQKVVENEQDKVSEQEGLVVQSKTIKDVVGKYVGTVSNVDNVDGDVSFTLNLYENGVFTYVYSMYIPRGLMGNYVVDGNNIILTNWFNSGSDVSLRITKGLNTLIINEDGSITDNDISLGAQEVITSVILVKVGVVDEFSLTDRLGVAFFNEVNHTIEEPNL